MKGTLRPLPRLHAEEVARLLSPFLGGADVDVGEAGEEACCEEGVVCDGSGGGNGGSSGSGCGGGSCGGEERLRSGVRDNDGVILTRLRGKPVFKVKTSSSRN